MRILPATILHVAYIIALVFVISVACPTSNNCMLVMLRVDATQFSGHLPKSYRPIYAFSHHLRPSGHHFPEIRPCSKNISKLCLLLAVAVFLA